LAAGVELARDALNAVVGHARAEAPRECCGFLLGQASLIREAAAGRNIAAPPTTRFLIDPQDHFDTLRSARARGLEILGFYHSHPYSAAQPSVTDRAEASYPGHLYLIVGLAAGAVDVRLFRLLDGNFTEVAFVTID
jgi:desampylase